MAKSLNGFGRVIERACDECTARTLARATTRPLANGMKKREESLSTPTKAKREKDGRMS